MIPLQLLLLGVKRAASSALANWRVFVAVSIVVITVGLGFYIKHIKTALHEAEMSAKHATEVAEENARRAKAIEETANNTLSVIVAERDEANARDNAGREREREILNEPQTDDAAPAPVLQRSIRRMRLAE